MTPEQIEKCRTHYGFYTVFWQLLRNAQKDGKIATYGRIYAEMEAECKAALGRPIFASLSAFRKFMSRNQ